MTRTQKRLARHALGLPNSTGRSYRNRYLAPYCPGPYDDWLSMVAAGLAEQHGRERSGQMSDIPPGGYCQPMKCGVHEPRRFMVTFDDKEAGVATFESEAEARSFWLRANGMWNCYLWATLPRDGPHAYVPGATTDGSYCGVCGRPRSAHEDFPMEEQAR
ncbi:hypothetical protein ATO13_23326 [Stappia sp. 22II-S9-Z10]|nr:hypothetical protein ATO13_23326 [Stappia sp. 22II-S9-Z10]